MPVIEGQQGGDVNILVIRAGVRGKSCQQRQLPWHLCATNLRHWGTTMPKIFISYRREDSRHAVGRLHGALKQHVKDPKRDIFIDIDNIPRGVDFVDHLDQQVAQCDVMLAVIGPHWLSVTDPNTGARRLDDPTDFVRIEVASALKRGIPVVPVVLDDTKIPSAEFLPDDLRALSRRNGERLEHESFDADVTRLIRNLPAAASRSRPAPARAPKETSGGGWIAPVIALAVLAVAGGGGAAWFVNPGDWRSRIGMGEPNPFSADSASTTGTSAAPVTPLAGPVVLSAEVNDALLTLDTARIADILKRGWNPNASLDTESSAALHTLMLACERNRTHDKAAVLHIAQALVAAGANVNQPNKWQDTPLSIARTPKYCGPDHPVTLYLQQLAGPAASVPPAVNPAPPP
jgi:hypothetical protein